MMKYESVMKKHYRLVFSLLILICASVMISLSFNNSVWFDEAYSTFMVRHSYYGIIEQNLTDVHPPLYYMALKLITSIFGYNLTVMKLFSIAGVTATMMLGATVVRKRFGSKAGFIWILLLLCAPNMLAEGAVMVRMYSWATFFVTGCALMAYEIYYFPSKSKYILFVVFSVLGAYFHTYALIGIGFVYIFLFIVLLRHQKEKLVKFFFCGITTAIIYSPWLVVLFKQVGMVAENYWIDKITVSSLVSYIKFIFLPSKLTGLPAILRIAVVALFCLLIVSAAIALIMAIRKACVKKDKDMMTAILAFLLFACPIFLGIIVSFLLRPVFIARYMLPMLGLFWLFVSIVISKSNKLMISTFLCIVLLSGIFSYRDTFIDEYQTQTDATVEFLQNEIDSTDVFVTDIVQLGEQGGPIMYYFPDNKSWCFDDGKFYNHYTNFGGMDSNVDMSEVNGVSGSLWYLCKDNDQSNLQWFTDNGYSVTQSKSGGIDIYDFAIYEITKN